MVTRKKEAEKVKESKIEENDCEIEKEESGNQCEEQERGVALYHLIDKNYPWKRTKDQTLNEPNPSLPDYIKLPYPITKKKLVQEDVARMFENFKDMLKQLQVRLCFHEILKLISKFIQVLMNGGNQKLTQE